MVGYSVLYVDEDTTVKGVLWEKRVVYSDWNKALAIARKKAEEQINSDNNINLISIVNSNSQSSCDKNGDARVFTLKHKTIGEIGNIYIVPVFIE
jgi:hypothetical protein